MTNFRLWTPGKLTNVAQLRGSTYRLRAYLEYWQQFWSTALPVVGAQVSRTAVMTLTSGIETTITWNTEDWEYGANFITGGVKAGSDSNLYAPIKGLYRIHGECVFDANATGQRWVYVYKNGTSDLVGKINQEAVSDGAAETRMAIPGYLVRLEQDDYVILRTMQNSGGNLDVNTDSYFGLILEARH